MTNRQINLTQNLITIYGPMMSGEKLYGALGFQTYGAFRLAKERGEIPIGVFKIPKRRDWHALTTDVADWLANVNQTHESTPEEKEA
jgi:hypothetical protein